MLLPKPVVPERSKPGELAVRVRGAIANLKYPAGESGRAKRTSCIAGVRSGASARACSRAACRRRAAVRDFTHGIPQLFDGVKLSTGEGVMCSLEVGIALILHIIPNARTPVKRVDAALIHIHVISDVGRHTIRFAHAEHGVVRRLKVASLHLWLAPCARH